MGLFNDDTNNRRDEVVINAPEEKGNETKLKEEVSSKIAGRAQGSDGSGKDIDLNDIHEQNKRIIELLEKINGDEKEGFDGNRTRGRKNGNKTEGNKGMRGGMDELL